VERKYARRDGCGFDRGIVSEENLEALRRRGSVSGGHARAKLKQFEQPLLAEGWSSAADVEVKLVPSRKERDLYLCRSQARRAKEQAIRSRFSTRMEKALTALEKRVVAGQLKDAIKSSAAWGRFRPPSASR